MAITKLMNLKSDRRGRPTHLRNCLEYILNMEKTEGGKLVGGNAGSVPGEVFQTMMDTKVEWEKTGGRQGYHFVISFKPGDADEEMAYRVIGDFCREYLGDRYDYVFAVHNDQDHIHGHIVFNSVSRADGYKYHYVKGDWEKEIQPITDRVCERYGLPPLEFEDGNRIGRSYAQWEAEKKGKASWKKIVRSDIDYAAGKASGEEEFLQVMEEMGYQVRAGTSRKHGRYFTFLAPGQKRGWRSYNLGDGYSCRDILMRIQSTNGTRRRNGSPGIRSGIFRVTKNTGRIPGYVPAFQKKRIRYIYFISYCRWNTAGAENQRAVRKSLIHIGRLEEDVGYLIRNGIGSMEELLGREQDLLREEKRLKNRQYSTEFLEEDPAYREYAKLKRELEAASRRDDARAEEIMDRIEALEEELPDAALGDLDKREQVREELQKIREEKRIIRHIKREEQDNEFLKTPWTMRTVPKFGTLSAKEKRQWQKK